MWLLINRSGELAGKINILGKWGILCLGVGEENEGFEGFFIFVMGNMVNSIRN